jgi:hypothetical protein
LQFIFRNKGDKSDKASFISGAAIVITISWLLFQSPALYYYIHILPIVIAAIFIVIGKRLQRTKVTQVILKAFAITLCYCGVKDATVAGNLSQSIERDNHAAIAAAMDSIRGEQKQSAIPIVLAQNPAIAIVEHDRNVQLMTAHFISFPLSRKPIADVIKYLGVNYILLYAARDGSGYSQEYNVLRPTADSIGTVVLRKTGTLLDVHRDYFGDQTDASRAALNDNQDTLILYRLPSIAR